MPGRTSKIVLDLSSRGLPSDFNGKAVDKWSVTDLKKFIRVFSPVPARTQGLDKHQLCLKLMQLKGSPVSAAESQTLSAMLDKEITVDAAQSQLAPAHATSIGPQSRQTCELCSETRPKSQFPTSAQPGSNHSHQDFTICIPCLRKHIGEKSKTSPYLDMIPCPEERCDAVLEDILIQHADLAILQRYNNHVSRQLRIKQPGYVECSTPSCPFTGPLPSNIPPSNTATDFTCPVCHSTTCKECSTPNHPGQNHDQNTLTLRAQIHQEITTDLTNLAPPYYSPLHAAATPVTTKPCPNADCRTLLSLNVGCPNARCPACWYKFCWHCEAPITKGGFCNHTPGRDCHDRIKRYALREVGGGGADDTQVPLKGRKAKRAAYLTQWLAENGE